MEYTCPACHQLVDTNFHHHDYHSSVSSYRVYYDHMRNLTDVYLINKDGRREWSLKLVLDGIVPLDLQRIEKLLLLL